MSIQLQVPPVDPAAVPYIRTWLEAKALATYEAAAACYESGNSAEGIRLYEAADTAWRWLRELDAEAARILRTQP